MDKIVLSEHKIEVRHSKAYKQLSLRMAPGKGIWVNVPYGFSDDEVVSFVSQYRVWIEKNIAKYNEDRVGCLNYEIGSVVRTRFHVFEIRESEVGLYTIDKRENRVIAYVPSSAEHKTLNEIANREIVKLYQAESKAILPQRVKQLAEKFGFRYGKLTFRNNVSNWGSCSATNNISLNVNLMKAPDSAIDYVILHELCHTIEKNHSEKFWQLVQRVCPNYKELREQLKKVK